MPKISFAFDDSGTRVMIPEINLDTVAIIDIIIISASNNEAAGTLRSIILYSDDDSGIGLMTLDSDRRNVVVSLQVVGNTALAAVVVDLTKAEEIDRTVRDYLFAITQTANVRGIATVYYSMIKKENFVALRVLTDPNM